MKAPVRRVSLFNKSHGIPAQVQFRVLQRRGGLVVGCLMVCAAAAASGSGPNIVTVWNMVLDQNKPLPAVVLAEQLLAEKSISTQELVQIYALTGDAKGTAAIIDGKATAPDPMPVPELIGYSPQPAIQAIVEAARSRRVVMLNESHQDQRHRAFALRLARELRKIGYTHIGAETFSTQVNESMEDGAPDGKSGLYTADPLFADFVRQSKKLGYALFPYEQRPEQRSAGDNGRMLGLASREQAQADNIGEILKADPRARVFIYAGGSHLMEEADVNGNEWMALRLKRLTDVDPLTIDQTNGTPRSTAELDGSLYRSVASTFSLIAETMFEDGKGNFLSQPGFDAIVFHPRDAASSARPGWLSMEGYRRPQEIQLVPMEARRMIRAFLVGEPVGSIPMDQLLVPPNSERVELMLPRGKYRIEEQSESGQSVVLGYLHNGSYKRAEHKIPQLGANSPIEQ